MFKQLREFSTLKDAPYALHENNVVAWASLNSVIELANRKIDEAKKRKSVYETLNMRESLLCVQSEISAFNEVIRFTESLKDVLR